MRHASLKATAAPSDGAVEGMSDSTVAGSPQNGFYECDATGSGILSAIARNREPPKSRFNPQELA
ncbi:MAG: hypothetical protein GY903_32980 [Fuerstiella sp.]|nr:hypothetical protein [Fuerstiella sp.]MCP4859307.1 hypothetical protein [Fuerstiella sp.]